MRCSLRAEVDARCSAARRTRSSKGRAQVNAWIVAVDLAACGSPYCPMSSPSGELWQQSFETWIGLVTPKNRERRVLSPCINVEKLLSWRRARRTTCTLREHMSYMGLVIAAPPALSGARVHCEAHGNGSTGKAAQLKAAVSILARRAISRHRIGARPSAPPSSLRENAFASRQSRRIREEHGSYGWDSH